MCNCMWLGNTLTNTHMLGLGMCLSICSSNCIDRWIYIVGAMLFVCVRFVVFMCVWCRLVGVRLVVRVCGGVSPCVVVCVCVCV